MIEQQFFFESCGSMLFGMLFSPSGEGKGGVLVYHPFAEEKKCSQRFLVELGRRLCCCGYHVLLFDLYGCGDSAGNSTEADVSIWMANIHDAATVLKQQVGTKDVQGLGLRLGSFLCLLSLCMGVELTSVVLIEPILDCKIYFQHCVKSSLIRGLLTSPDTCRSDGSVVDLSPGSDLWADLDGHGVSTFLHDGLLRGKKVLEDELMDTLVSCRSTVYIYKVSQAGRWPREYDDFIERLMHHNVPVHRRIVKQRPFWTMREPEGFGDLVTLVTSDCT